MVISNKYKFIYLKSKKTGSISLSLALGQIIDPNTDITYKFSKYAELQRSLGIKPNAFKILNKEKGLIYKIRPHTTWKKLYELVTDPEDFFKFTVERNPWDKVVSVYHYLLMNNNNKKKQNVVKQYDFNEFVDKTTWWKIPYNWPLYTDEKDNIKVDYICKYENLSSELKYIESQIGVNFTHLMKRNANANFRKKRDYRTFYNKESRKKVQESFKKEIEYFNYEF